MLILIIALIIVISAIWAGVGTFSGMLANYIQILSPESVGVVKCIPYLEYGAMIIIGILVLQTYQITKVKCE